MATKVYLNGRNITIDKDGETPLSIRTDRAEYIVFMPFLSTSGVTPNEPEDIQFKDVFYGTSITDKIENVTDQAGTTYANLTSLQVYLSTFFQRASGQTIIKEGATSDNQNTIIDQNTEIIENTTATKENTYELNKIKDLEKEQNKILKKIYNHE